MSETSQRASRMEGKTSFWVKNHGAARRFYSNCLSLQDHRVPFVGSDLRCFPHSLLKTWFPLTSFFSLYFFTPKEQKHVTEEKPSDGLNLFVFFPSDLMGSRRQKIRNRRLFHSTAQLLPQTKTSSVQFFSCIFFFILFYYFCDRRKPEIKQLVSFEAVSREKLSARLR